MASSSVQFDSPPTPDDNSPGTTADMGGGSSASPMPDTKELARGFIAKVKDFSTGIEEMARQYPSGSKEFKKAQDSLKDAMAKVITELQKQGGGRTGSIAA